MKTILLGIAILVFFLQPTSPVFASVIFEDNFHGVDGTKLSEHNGAWSFLDYHPGTSEWGEYQILSNQASDGTGTVYNINRLNKLLPNHFIASLDFTINSGVSSDPNLAFIDMKFDNSTESNEYLFRFYVNQPQAETRLDTFGPVRKTTNLGTFITSGTNTVTIEYRSGTFTALINNTYVMGFSDTTFVPDHLIIDQTRYVPTAKLIAFKLENPDVTPPPTPTPITRFSQRDPMWKDKTYDKAASWSPANPTIDRWGCSVSAASTVLDYYGIHTLPGGASNNPGNLNDWLTSQSDGFFRHGALNWNAIARLSKLASMDQPTIPSLEYKYKTLNLPDLQARLSQLQPVILEEPGHFITAFDHNTTSGATAIVDPFWGTSRPTLSSYGDTYVSARTFTPSHTNLGYIFVETDQEIAPKLFAKSGSAYLPVETAVSHVQNPLVDPEHTLIPLSQPFQLLEFPQPADETYRINVHRVAPGMGSFKVYTYDAGGNPTTSSFTSLFGTSDTTLSLSYTASGSSSLQKNISFEVLKQDIFTAKEMSAFRFQYQGSDLVKLLDLTARLYPKYPSTAKDVYRLYMKLLTSRKPFMTQGVHELIMADSNLLLSQLF